MSKIIKKQLKRSMPLFIIFCLLCSTFAVGLVFNYDISVSYKDGKLSFNVNNPEAQADGDTATTTVTVKNAPPTFNGFPAEVPASTSTSPVNIGYPIGFSTQASDVEGNSFYLIICDAPGVTASTTGGAPTCTGHTLCVSGLTGIASAASCTDASVVDPISLGGSDDEMQDWYAYVCDNHATEGACSDTYSQGASANSGNDSSPFYVNHAPVYTAVTTTIDNRDPSQLYTVTASVTDVDTRGGNDELDMYVCQSNVWSTTTGCAIPLCAGTSTSPNPSCQFATSTVGYGWVAKDGTYPYFTFVKDWHEMPAAANSRSANYTVNNVAPSVSNVILNNSANITLNLKGAPGKVVIATGTISDLNGCTDVNHATSAVYMAGTSGGWRCTANDDNCYQIVQANCMMVSGTCDVYPDASVDYVCSTTLAFHADPTDVGNSNPNSGTWWEAAVDGFDEALNGAASSTVNIVDVIQAPALNVVEAAIPYGSIRGGMDSGAANATTTVEVYGNMPIDTTFLGVDMLRTGGGGWIGSDQQMYSLANFTYPAGTWTLSSTTNPVRDLDLPKPTTAAIDVSDPVYWGINIPAGKLSGIYNGSNTFASVGATVGW
jgi:hypothetical protein